MEREKPQERRSNTRTLVQLMKKKIRGVISGNYLHKRKKNDTSVLNHTFVEGRLLKATVIWAHREQMQRCGTSLQNNQVPKNQSSFMPSFR